MKKVLILAADPAIMKMLCQIIRTCNKNVCVFQTADVAKAYQIVITNDIELILVDIILDRQQPKDISGLRFVADIREIERYAFVPVIILSALMDERLYVFHELHCYGFLEKPFSKEYAAGLIRDAMRYRMEKREKKYICFRQGCVVCPVRIAEIIYIEHKRRKMFVHTVHDVIQIPYQTCQDTLTELADYGFAVCARGIIVNLKFVQSLDGINQCITLKGGFGRLELGRVYIKEIRDALQDM